MLILRGTPALSDFRLQKLSSDFKAAGIPVASVYAEFLHVVDLSADLTASEKETLEKALEDPPRINANQSLTVPIGTFLCSMQSLNNSDNTYTVYSRAF